MRGALARRPRRSRLSRFEALEPRRYCHVGPAIADFDAVHEDLRTIPDVYKKVFKAHVAEDWSDAETGITESWKADSSLRVRVAMVKASLSSFTIGLTAAQERTWKHEYLHEDMIVEAELMQRDAGVTVTLVGSVSAGGSFALYFTALAETSRHEEVAVTDGVETHDTIERAVLAGSIRLAGDFAVTFYVNAGYQHVMWGGDSVDQATAGITLSAPPGADVTNQWSRFRLRTDVRHSDTLAGTYSDPSLDWLSSQWTEAIDVLIARRAPKFDSNVQEFHAMGSARLLDGSEAWADDDYFWSFAQATTSTPGRARGTLAERIHAQGQDLGESTTYSIGPGKSEVKSAFLRFNQGELNPAALDALMSERSGVVEALLADLVS